MHLSQILLVDDDADDRALFKHCIGRNKISVHLLEAENGLEAIRMLRLNTKQPDIIFLDINMPVMDGYSCLFKIKSDERLKNIPVIMFSTANKIFEETTALQKGALRYIQKPPSLSEFCLIIKTVVETIL